MGSRFVYGTAEQKPEPVLDIKIASEKIKVEKAVFAMDSGILELNKILKDARVSNGKSYVRSVEPGDFDPMSAMEFDGDKIESDDEEEKSDIVLELTPKKQP
jgi:hypothetical protein